MPNVHTTLTSLFSAIANAIRGKTGSSSQIVADDFPSAIDAIPTGTPLPPLTNPATAADVLDGKEVILPDANDEPVKVTGTLEAPYDAMELMRGSMDSKWENVSGFKSNKITIDLSKSGASATALFCKASFLPNTHLIISLALSVTTGVNIYQAFRACTNLKKLSLTTNAISNAFRTFTESNQLEEIDGILDFSKSGQNGLQETFPQSYNSPLKEVRFAPNCIFAQPYANFIRSCSQLSDATIISLANALGDGLSYIITLNATPKARTLAIMGTVSQITEEGVTYNFFTADESGTTSLNAFITTVKGWTLA